MVVKFVNKTSKLAPSSDFDYFGASKQILRKKDGNEVSLSIVKDLMHLKSDNSHLREQQNKVARNVRYFCIMS